MYGICNLSLVPCRKEPANTSEMVTQLLFGEHFTILETHNDGWFRINIASDGYECWVNEKQVSPISHKTFETLQSKPACLSAEFISVIANKKNGLHFPIVMGSVLPNFLNGDLGFEKEEFHFSGNTLRESDTGSAKQLTETAMQYLEAPYLWGGKSIFGIDCSGFTQLCFRLNGIRLPRDAYQQAELGTTLSFVEEAKTGDLAFFDNEEGKIVHVGIVLEQQKIIHASGKVRIDRFDHQGIFNEDRRKYSHNLRVIKSVLK